MVKCSLFSSHYALIPSHRGQRWKPTANQVQPPPNAETAPCGRRRWTSTRRAPSPPRRSRDRRLFSSGSVRSHLWTKLTNNSFCGFYVFFFLGNLWTFQGGAGPHRGSSACTKGRKTKHPESHNKSCFCTFFVDFLWSTVQAYHDPMLKLSIMTEEELAHIFGDLDAYIPLHEGKWKTNFPPLAFMKPRLMLTPVFTCRLID